MLAGPERVAQRAAAGPAGLARPRDDVIDVRYQSRRDGSFALGDRADGGTAHVHRWSPLRDRREIDGRRTTTQITRAGDRLHVQAVRGTIAFGVVPRFVVPGAAAPSGGLMAPMPGVVLDVRCAPGRPGRGRPDPRRSRR